MNQDKQDADFLRTLTLLYVEDDEGAREQTRVFLEHRVAKVITASNGAEGLAAFQEHQPHIVITDILMPVMDGLAMGQKIRDLGSKVPLIITTAFEQTDYCLRSIDIQADKYVLKPIQTAQLNAALLEVAHRLRAEDQLKRQQRLEERERRLQQEEAIAILAGGMAHDYNNLLQSLLSGVSLAKAYSEPTSKVHAALAMTDACWQQARELGQRLIILAQASDSFAVFGTIVPLVMTTARTAIEGTNATLETHLPADLPPIRFYEAKIQMVVANLVTNAVEAMPAGGLLTIAGDVVLMEETEDLYLSPGSYLHLAFLDNGRGISPEHLPRIFDPYFTTKERGRQRGTGLGLALCRAIIQSHRGAIQVDSKLGAGASFHVYLPMPVESQGAQAGTAFTSL